MISIVWQGDHRYNVYQSGEDIGCITVSDSPFHNTHRYLNLGLTQYDPSISKDLFSRLRKELGQPLQIMLYSKPELCNFLTAGGFVRKRRCYELEVASSNLAISPAPTVELHTVHKGSVLYNTCCNLLYAYYSATHEAVSPLTATQEVFCTNLPKTVVCCVEDGKPVHYAFIEPDEVGYEIAYVGTTDFSSFSCFAQTLVHELFQKCDSLAAECDDTDPAAMQLMQLFNISIDGSYDTYILE